MPPSHVTLSPSRRHALGVVAARNPLLPLQEWSPLVRSMNWFIARIPGGSRNVFLNTKQQYEFSGFPPPDSEENALAMHSFNYVALIHHTIGAALLLASFASNDAQLFRLGLSFEIGETAPLSTRRCCERPCFTPSEP